jgi:hypothetical protein
VVAGDRQVYRGVSLGLQPGEPHRDQRPLLRLLGLRSPDEHGGAYACRARISDVLMKRDDINARLRCMRCGARGEAQHIAIDAIAW